MNIISKLLFKNPRAIKLGSIWWDDDGHYSECNDNMTYIVLGKNKEKYWTCVGLTYWGNEELWLGGCNSRKKGHIEYSLTDDELLSMKYIGMIPSWKIRIAKEMQINMDE